MKLLTVQFSPVPSHLLSLTTKYLPQHLIFEHPQPTFSPQCERLTLTPMQNWQNGSSVDLDIDIVR
jgi:hypothetical protein